MKKFAEPEWSSKKRAHHKPLRSFKELCAEFKVNPKAMAGYMGTDPTHPTPVYRVGNQNWFDPEAFRKWYKQHSERKSNV